MRSGSRLRVHGICGIGLVHREVIEARSNYKRSYLWWLRKFVSGDSTGSGGLGKDSVLVFPGHSGEKGEGVVRWFDSVCEEYF